MNEGVGAVILALIWATCILMWGELLHHGTMSAARPTTGDMKTSMTKLQISSQRKRDSARNLGTARVLWMTQSWLTSPLGDRQR